MIYHVLEHKTKQNKIIREKLAEYNYVWLATFIMNSHAHRSVNIAGDILGERIYSLRGNKVALITIRNLLKGHAKTLEGYMAQTNRIAQIDKLMGVDNA